MDMNALFLLFTAMTTMTNGYTLWCNDKKKKLTVSLGYIVDDTIFITVLKNKEKYDLNNVLLLIDVRYTALFIGI